MPRGTDEQTRVHIWLFKDDVEEIRAMYAESIGFSKAIRNMVRSTLRQVRARAGVSSEAVKVSGDELEGLIDGPQG